MNVKQIVKDFNKASDLREMEGAVIRFVSYDIQKNHRYTYAAVYAVGFWWITGVANYFGTNKFTHAQFMELLVSDAITEAAVATTWTYMKSDIMIID